MPPGRSSDATLGIARRLSTLDADDVRALATWMTANIAATGPGGGVTFWTGAGTVAVANTSITNDTGIGMFCGGAADAHRLRTA